MRTVATRPVVRTPYQKITEVPLDYQGDSTFVVNCGSAQMRVIIDQWLMGAELREYCKVVKGWNVGGLSLVVTGPEGKVARFAPPEADTAVIQPTVRVVEYVKRMGEKG